MQTRREWLVSKGLATPGRGKFSAVAHAAIAKAESEGVTFSDSAKTAAKVTTEKTAKAKPTASPVDTPYVEPSSFRFPEDEYVAREVGGKTHGMREVCSNCGYSLVNHLCNSPMVHGEFAVSIVRR